MHDLLKETLSEHEMTTAELPTDLKKWKAFIESIDFFYKDMEQERFLAEKSLAASSRELTERWAESHKSNEDKKESIQLLGAQNRLLQHLSTSPTFVEFMSLFLEECLKELNLNSGSVFQVVQNNMEFLISNGQGDATRHIRWVLQRAGDKVTVEAPYWLIPIQKSGQEPYGCLTFYIGDIPPDRKQIQFLEALIPLAVIAYERDRVQQRAEDEQIKVISSSKKAALGDMAGGIAHEINNPLAIISMTVQKLKILNSRDTVSQTDLLKDFNKIERTVERISAIIKALRAFSRDDSTVANQKDDLGRILEETLTLCSEKMKNNGIEIRNKIAEDETLPLFCNPVQISQVLLNLISNSYDAIEGSESPWIEFSTYTKDQGKFLVIVVADSGPGIPKALLDKIMIPFFTTKEVGRGTGIGLSLSLGLARSHGGNLTYNEKSKTTEFHLELPTADFRLGSRSRVVSKTSNI